MSNETKRHESGRAQLRIRIEELEKRLEFQRIGHNHSDDSIRDLQARTQVLEQEILNFKPQKVPVPRRWLRWIFE